MVPSFFSSASSRMVSSGTTSSSTIDTEYGAPARKATQKLPRMFTPKPYCTK